MGKKKAGSTNIAAMVREYCTAHPDDKPLQIQKALSKKGFEVKTQYIATLRSNSKKQAAEAAAMDSEEPAASAPAASAPTASAPTASAAASTLAANAAEPTVKPAAEPRRTRPLQNAADVGDSKLKQVRIGALIQLRELGRELGGFQEVRDIVDLLEDFSN